MTQKACHFDCSESHQDCMALRRDSLSAGVTDPDDQPFMLHPPGATSAVLLVHGFTATPWEMRLLAEALARAGIACIAVRLPGHGTSPEDLAVRSWEEWYGAVHFGYQILSKEFPTVFGIGMSTGCLLLLELANAEPLQGLVLYSPYLRVLHWLAPYAGLLRWLLPYHEKAAEKDEQRHYYNRRPLAAIHQINRLLQKVRRQLPKVMCPVLAFNGEGDQTVEFESGRQLVELLGSSVKIHELYGPEVSHVLTREENPCREAMFTQTTRFIQEINKPGSSSKFSAYPAGC